mmetsp:Transcript_9792/g.19885  ORF Transcript_9792/g.19885 Transcript_9792/m.19885 type:complete len:239 (-) Transcript_9792:59-775(-)
MRPGRPLVHLMAADSSLGNGMTDRGQALLNVGAPHPREPVNVESLRIMLPNLQGHEPRPGGRLEKVETLLVVELYGRHPYGVLDVRVRRAFLKQVIHPPVQQTRLPILSNHGVTLPRPSLTISEHRSPVTSHAVTNELPQVATFKHLLLCTARAKGKGGVVLLVRRHTSVSPISPETNGRNGRLRDRRPRLWKGYIHNSITLEVSLLNNLHHALNRTLSLGFIERPDTGDHADILRLH